MNSRALFGRRIVQKISHMLSSSRTLCSHGFRGSKTKEEFDCVEEPLKKVWVADSDCFMDDARILNEYESSGEECYSTTQNICANARVDAKKVLRVLQQDGPGFDAKVYLEELRIRVSGLLVREVLLGILRSTGFADKSRCVKLGYKFFVWSGMQENYVHTTDAYHLMMKIFAECDEFKAMWRLVDEMIENGFPTTARTFHILICTCGEVGLARVVVERFIKSKAFIFRPHKNSYNAILHSLVVLKQYKLIEWVYQQMLAEGLSPDILTYNILMCAKYRLGKLDQFRRLLGEMEELGLSPDVHTYNLILHVLGKGDRLCDALKLLNHMREVGIDPTVLHFTTLMDGFSRAGNLNACRNFFDEMIKNKCKPDVVCYTVLITGYVVAGELEKAVEMFNQMIVDGQLPNVFTYNSMIRGYCMAGNFAEACSMLNEMEARGCTPNFLVYSTLVSYMRNAGKLSEARSVIKRMVEKGQYVKLVSKFKGYKRC